MEEKWFQKNRQADFAVLAREAGISEVTARVIVNRGINSMDQFWQYVRPELSRIADPMKMKDMEQAVAILLEKLRQGASIRVVGDYDVDGVMSTYILLRGLRRVQRELEETGKTETVKIERSQIDYEIPDRILDGYGLNISILDQAAADGVDTILTCDNGIAAAEQIAHGKTLGLTIVVTDHHDIPFEKIAQTEEVRELLPPADAVVNPKRSDCPYPFPNLCGAGVAWQLVRALYQQQGIPIEEAEELLEMVALATVCDVMELLGENRILVKCGLRKLQATANIGLQALLAATGMEDRELTSYHCGFVIGPCINASGRLESAKQGLRLLLSDHRQEADLLAASLVALNEERKSMTAAGVEEAVCQSEKRLAEGDRVLVCYLPDCHESIAGIIAGRIRERFYRPTLILTKGEPYIKGSGRSIEEYNMFAQLSACKELFSKFGGHPLAAGFSLTGDAPELVEGLRQRLNEQANLTEEDLLPKVSFDQVLPFSAVTEELLAEFDELAPFGKGNPKPLFALRNITVRSARVLGKNRNVVRLALRENAIGSGIMTGIGKEYQGILFEDGDVFLAYIAEQFGEAAAAGLERGGSAAVRLDIIFCPEINEYQGYRNIQMVVEHYRKSTIG